MLTEMLRAAHRRCRTDVLAESAVDRRERVARIRAAVATEPGLRMLLRFQIVPGQHPGEIGTRDLNERLKARIERS